MNCDFSSDEKGGIITSIQINEMIRQMEENICLIHGINDEQATGFFCKLPYPDQLNLIPVLITNNKILNKENTQLNKTIKLTINDGKKEFYLSIDSSRKVFIDESLGITIIEIKQKDKIDNFFDLEDNLDIENYMKKDQGVYILYYTNDENASYSGGILNSIFENDIIHTCKIGIECQGAPILLLSNFKVIGIHIGTMNKYENKGYNKGIYINLLKEEFQKKFPININNNQNNNYNNQNNNNQNNNYNNHNNFNNQTYNNNQNNINNNQNNNFNNQAYNNNQNNNFNNQTYKNNNNNQNNNFNNQ